MVVWPKMYHIKRKYDQDTLKNIEQQVKLEVDKIVKGKSLPRGSRIAITVGSRGIANIISILNSIVEAIEEKGYQPFLFSAMGSHGGGTTEGQLNILRSLGITEESVHCPISVSTEVLEIGETDKEVKGLPVYIAKEAMEADGIIVVNRVKAHTSFDGRLESGLAKMMVVGMGRAKGAATFHRISPNSLSNALLAIASKVLEESPILGGIAIVENALEQTETISGIIKENMLEQEGELLIKAKRLSPKLPVEHLDFLVVQEMGKNYSGTGMDTNVIGRLRIEGNPEPVSPNIRYIAVLNLSKQSHGNATGIGLADFTTESFVKNIDKKATYLNCMTSGFVIRAAIPMYFSNDKELFENVITVLKSEDVSSLRIAIIKNTLHLDEMWVSEEVYHQIRMSSHVKIIEENVEIKFDNNGRLNIE